MAPDRTSMYAKLLQAEDDAEAANEEAAANPTGRTTALAAKRAARQQSAEAIRTIAKAKEAKLKADAAEAAAAAEAVRKKVFAAKMKSEKAKQEADEFAIAEMDRKTKRFTLKDGRGRVKETGALYFGDYEDLQAGAWQPHGFGEFRVNGETIYEGNFFKGRVCGNGYIKFLNDDDWRGSFRNDEPHGLGIYKYSSGQPPRAALYFRSRRACFLDELIPGTRIRMVGRKWKLGGLTTGTVLSSDNVADVALRGTMREMLARLVGTAKIRVKFDLGPVQMVNLAEEEFEIVHGQPSCHMHDHFIEDAGTLRPRYVEEDIAAAAPTSTTAAGRARVLSLPLHFYCCCHSYTANELTSPLSQVPPPPRRKARRAVAHGAA